MLDGIIKQIEKGKPFFDKIAQNIYLFSAVNGLNTVFKGSVDSDYFKEALQLSDNMEVIGIQDIGFPPEE